MTNTSFPLFYEGIKKEAYNNAELKARVDVGRRIVGMQNRLTAQIGELRQAIPNTARTMRRASMKEGNR